MEKKNTMRVITLEDLWTVFANHILPIVLAAVLCVGLLFAYSTFVVTPKYSSTSTLYILRQERSNDYVYTQSDFALALNVVNDCAYMVKSHEVLDKVIDKLDLDMSYKALCNSISITNPDNTRILEIRVENEDAQQAKEIVDAICSTAANRINKTMGVDQVNVYSKGTVGIAPSNSTGISKYVLTAVIAAFAVYAIYLVALMLDDKIKTEEDVQKYLGLSVLGMIPNSKDSKYKSKKYGYYSSGAKQSEKSKKGGKAK